MIRQNKKMLLLTSIITLLPVFIGLFLWNQLPDSVATHFGLDNQPDGYSSKAFAVFGLPLILLAVHLVCVVATNIDPKSKDINKKIFRVLLWICPLVSLFVSTVIYGYSLGYDFDMSYLCGILIGVLYLVLGNFLPTVKPNYTIGFRIPWTLNNHGNRRNHYDPYLTTAKHVDTACRCNRSLPFASDLFLSVLPQILILYHCI